MDKDKAEELLEELTSYRTEHSYDYPADFIYTYKLSFQYELFKDSDKVNCITVVFPRLNSTQLFDELFSDWFGLEFYVPGNYCKDREYHKRLRYGKEEGLREKVRIDDPSKDSSNLSEFPTC